MIFLTGSPSEPPARRVALRFALDLCIWATAELSSLGKQPFSPFGYRTHANKSETEQAGFGSFSRKGEGPGVICDNPANHSGAPIACRLIFARQSWTLRGRMPQP
jgi:hypothetical protein